MRLLLKICVLSLSLFPALLFAQKEIAFEHISIPEGLSNPQVFSLIQDRFGYIWIGTQDGLNRYDGYQFVTYRNEPGDTSSIMDNFVFCAFEDSAGTLWFGTSTGLSRYDRNRDRFTNFHPVPLNAAIPNQWVFAIGEKDGNHLWIGCNLGLYIMDTRDNTFKPQFVLSNDIEKEINGMVSEFTRTSDGTELAFSATYGLLRYDAGNKIFVPVPIEKGPVQLLRDRWMLSVYEDSAGNLWLASQAGFFKYTPDKKAVEQIDLYKMANVKAPEPSVTRLLPINEHEIWICSLAGLFRYNITNGSYRLYSHNPGKKNSLNSNYLINIMRDRAGVLWIATQGAGIDKFDPQKEPFNFYTLKPAGADETTTNPVSGFVPAEGRPDQYWISTLSGGLYLYNHKTHEYRSWQTDPRDPGSICSNSITCLAQGDGNTLWLGSNGAGMDRFDPATQKFRHYKNDPARSNTISDDNITSIIEDKQGRVWIGTSFGLNKFDPKKERFEVQPAVRTRTYPKNLIGLADSLYKNRRPLSAITQVGDNENITKKFQIERTKNVLVISGGEGLAIWGMVDYGWIENAKADTVWALNDYFKTYYFGGTDKNRIRMQTMTLDPGTYTLCYRSDDSHSYGHWNAPAPADSFFWGIQVFDINENDFKAAQNTIRRIESRKVADYSNVNDILIAGDSLLWLATNQGLIKYDLESGDSESFLPDNLNINSVINNIRDLYRDAEGILWLASDGGLYRFDPKIESIIFFTQANGLPSPYIRAILEDGQGDLWLSSASGIFRLKKPERLQKLSLVKYDIKDGLQGYQYIGRAAYRSDDGQLFFGGTNGFNAFYPGRINTTPPDLVISKFYISNREITPTSEDSPLVQALEETGSITLSYDQNDISFDFAALHYSRPENNQTAYMLAGLQPDWVTDNRRYASFTNLAPGDYVFKIRGANSDGIWSTGAKSIKITILPPWWLTIWAYIGYGLFFVGLVIGIDRFQRYRLMQRERNRTQIREAELRAQAAEAESRAIRAENERKTHELEEARRLQLSMLPKQIPELPHLDIAVYMKTATEVGGDYYDFHVSLDGTLTVVIGDATGHGLKAGTMVTAAKSLFSSHAANPDILYTFTEIGRCIKLMDMHMLSMCLAIVKIANNHLLISSAGMPPALLYRGKDNLLEEIEIKGMPLGTFTDFPYEIRETKLKSGDTLLLMSDGFPELFNTKNELFGYERVSDVFQEVAGGEVGDIIENLKVTAKKWSGDAPPKDDITFVVIKAR